MEKQLSRIEEYNATLTAAERSESARRAGRASGEARRQYRSQRELLRRMLATDVDDKALADALRAAGFEPTFGAATVLAQARKAAAGDTEAARYLRDTVGEKPTEAYQIAMSDKPIKSIDLSGMTDEELQALADQADG